MRSSKKVMGLLLMLGLVSALGACQQPAESPSSPPNASPTTSP
jgi:hypothetical protein